MRKPTICIGENKGADQLRSNWEADHRLCFHYTDRSIPVLSKRKIFSLYPSSLLVQSGLCQTWSEPELLVFPHTGSFVFFVQKSTPKGLNLSHDADAAATPSPSTKIQSGHALSMLMKLVEESDTKSVAFTEEVG